jgi:hypothetical protein
VSDDDRLRERLRREADRVPDLADLDDVAVRLGRRRPVRERRLLALVALALVAGIGGGFALGRSRSNHGNAVSVAGSGAEETTTSPPTIPTTMVTEPAQTLPPPGPDQPADPDTARRQITKAYLAAYDGDVPDELRSEAIEDGSGLIGVFEQLRTGSFAAQVRSAHTVVDEIVFLSPTRAAVEFRSRLGDGSTSGPYFGDAVLNAEGYFGWEISHASYCQIIIPAGVHCPE